MRGSNHGEKGSGLRVEALEQRRLLSAVFVKADLIVVGTTGDDNIRIKVDELDPSRFFVHVNDKSKTFAVSKLVTTPTASKINIKGLGGNDRIEIDDVGLNFNAVINGGAGDDSIISGTANDRILGGSGSDTINGGLGNDSIYGNTGADLLIGGKGNDFFDGGSGSDTINGNRGTDRCHGGSGDDLIEGGSQQDLLDGGPGVDSVYGNEGNDIFLNKDDADSERKDFGPQDVLV